LNRLGHTVLYYFILMWLAIASYYKGYNMLWLAPLPFLIIFDPDWDLVFNQEFHRSLITHSLAFPALFAYIFSMIVKNILIVYYGIEIEITMLFVILFKYLSIPIIIHIFGDINWIKAKWKGYYCVVWIPGKRLKGWSSTLFLITNVVVGIILIVKL